MTQIHKGQIKAIHALLAKIGMANDKEYKADMVSGVTGGRETSTTRLSVDEAGKLISDLQAATGWTPEQKKANAKRRLILSYAHQMMWEDERGNVDVKRVDGWAKEYGYLHKPLNDYTLTELSKLVWQMEEAYKAFIKSV